MLLKKCIQIRILIDCCIDPYIVHYLCLDHKLLNIIVVSKLKYR